MMTPFL